jgi:hypothetical protein|tara:strand:+ start:7121 stop:7621 length:501 start_codon:yes stop_codon:yes gene_type:complete
MKDIDIKNKVIGTSLGLCIRDILQKDVLLKNVVMIYSSTNIQSFNDLEKVISSYSNDRWAFHDIDVVRKLIQYFLFKGMIQQERAGNGLYGGSYPCYNMTWQKLDDLKNGFTESILQVLDADFNKEDSGDIAQSDKTYNLNHRIRVQDMIDANYVLYKHKKEAYSL